MVRECSFLIGGERAIDVLGGCQLAVGWLVGVLVGVMVVGWWVCCCCGAPSLVLLVAAGWCVVAVCLVCV